MLRTIIMCLAFLFGSSAALGAEVSSEVIRVSPQGEDAPPSRRILFQFNTPLIPIGEQDSQKEPDGYRVDITPPTPCRLSWLNRSLLACTLRSGSSLKLATKYFIKLYKSDIGDKFTSNNLVHSFSFSVLPPKVLYVEQPIWDAPDIPYIPINFNQHILKKTLKSAFVFKSKSGSYIQSSVAPDPEDKTQPLYDTSGDEARTRWMLYPSQPLLEGTGYELALKPGLHSPHGPLTNTAADSLVKLTPFPKAQLSGIRCVSNENPPTQVFIASGKQQNKPCNPLGGIGLVFTSPVQIDSYHPELWFLPPLPAAPPTRPQSNPLLPVTGTPQEASNFVHWITCAPKAGVTYRLRSELEETVSDKFGRSLAKFPNLSIAMDHRKANVEIPYTTAVLEEHGDSDLPVFINNIKSLSMSYQSVSPTGSAVFRSKEIDTSQSPLDIQYAVPLGIRAALNYKSGFLQGTLSSSPNVLKLDKPASIIAQITPWQIHLKLGHFTGLAWVTDLKSGEPIEGARIRIYKGNLTDLNIPNKESILVDAVTDVGGLVRLPGTETLDPSLIGHFLGDDSSEKLMLRADGTEGGRPVMALLPVSDAFLLDPYRTTGESIYPTDDVKYGHIKAWGMTSRGVHRPGETIHFKIFVRNQNNLILTSAPQTGYRLNLLDPKGEVVYHRKNIRLDSWGAIIGEYQLPAHAASGSYSFKLTGSFQGPQRNLEDRLPECKTTTFGSLNDADLTAAAESLIAGVTDSPEDLLRFPLEITVANVITGAYKINTHVNGDHFRPGASIEIQSVAEMMSGGPFGGANAKTKATLEAAYFEPKSKVLEGFQFNGTSGDIQTTEIFSGTGLTKPDGSFDSSFSMPDSNIPFGRINFQTSVQDESGRITTARTTASYSAVRRFAGIKPKEWSPRSGKVTSVFFVAADERGLISNDSTVELKVEYLQVKSARVKSAGNAYTTETTETKELIRACRSAPEDTVSECLFTPEKSGTYQITAKVWDKDKRTHVTSTQLYVTGDDSVVWPDGDDYSLEIIPEQSDYHPGDVARFLIKNPYPGAYALVTTERYGVMDAHVTKLEGPSPVVELNILPDHLPGMYVSVTVFSPRQNDGSLAPKAGSPDLAKPTFRTGYVSIPVNDPYKRLKVDVKPDRSLYKPGDNVTLKFHAAPLHPVDTPAHIALTVAVTDESVLALEKNGADRFDPYKGFYSLEGLDLRNYSLLTRLTGRQKFEKKGANQGGDGASSVRNHFDSVAYWNPDVRTDASGDAAVTFKLPDNLTGWRVIVSAATPGEHFGYGVASIATALPTEIRPMLPAKVREGDHFQGMFLTSNHSEQRRTILTTVTTSVMDKDVTIGQVQAVMEPFSHSPVTFEVDVKSQISADKLLFKAEAHDAMDGDAVEASIPVLPIEEELFASESGQISQASKAIDFRAPAAKPGTAVAKITLSPSVLLNIKGALRSLKSYPHRCWEQQLSRAYGAYAYESMSKAIVFDSFTWSNASKLIQETVEMAAAFQASDGGMAYFNRDVSSGDPLLSAYTARLFALLAQAGYSIPQAVNGRLTSYLKTTLEMPMQENDLLAQSEIRAAITEALAVSKNITAEDLERIRPLLPRLSNSALASFVNSALQLKEYESSLLYALKLLSSRYSIADGSLKARENFSLMKEGGYEQYYDEAGAQCHALLSMISAAQSKVAAGVVNEDLLSAALRSVLKLRKPDGSWNSTIDNVLCTHAVIQYAQKFDNDSHEVKISTMLDHQVQQSISFKNPWDHAVTLSLPVSKAEKKKLLIKKEGRRTVYYDAEIRYVPESKNVNRMINHGFEVIRSYYVRRDGHWVIAENNSFTKGEIVKVVLEVKSESPHYFVALTDQIPGGFEPLPSELFKTTTSQSNEDIDPLIEQEERQDFTFNEQFYHREFTTGEARFYSNFLSIGDASISYMIRAINAGVYLSPPSRVQQMYHPDVFGQSDGIYVKIINVKK